MIVDPIQNRIDELFAQAVELPAAERSAFLDHACYGEPTLIRRKVERLLAADDELHATECKFLSEPRLRLASFITEIDVPAESLPQRIGRYEVKKLLGEGGFAKVYLAERNDDGLPLAVKVAKQTSTREVLERFAQEGQLLRVLQHESIARVYDDGQTDDGRPYFVMEYVDGGVPVTQYCHRHRLGIHDRLQLF